MATEERYINAYDFAEMIENLDITVAGKPARWNDAKYTVLKEIAEAPTADVVPRSEADKIRSEVAREIFEEINVTWSESYSVGEFFEDIAELKKKYTEGE